MKLLVCTQALDPQDPALGFFEGWLAELAKHCEQVTVICLRAHNYHLPANVTVLPLGRGRLLRAWQIIWLSFKFRREYDAVFVHMNQEYLLVAGWLWQLLGKRVYLWRNHYRGSFFTDVAAFFCNKIFCTSKYSYTAKYKKTVRMPVGVDIKRFSRDFNEARAPRSVLFLARMSPAKRPQLLLEALQILQKKGIQHSAALFGSPLPKDKQWYERLKAEGQSAGASFHPEIGNDKTPPLYSRYEIVVNCSPSGMYDKTMFEGMACECLILASSKDLAEHVDRRFIFEDNSAASLAQKLKVLLEAPVKEKEQWGKELRTVAQTQDLGRWAQRVYQEMQ